jgi:LysM repeat protein
MIILFFGVFVISRFYVIMRLAIWKKIMAEEPQVTLSTEEPRYCPACGARVAAMATTCLMCGASLEEEAVPEEEEEERRRLPSVVRGIIVVVLALVFLSALGGGIYLLLDAAPEVVAPTATPTLRPTATRTPTPTSTPTTTPTPTPVPPLAHQVQQGETLLVIAEDYDTTVEDILALNPDVDPNLLSVGQVLLIPAGTATPVPTPTFDPNAPTPTPGPIIHIVAPGETLSTIAEQYGISVELLRQANGLPIGNDTIVVNQPLVIPVGTPMPSPTPTVNPNATATPIPQYAAPPLLSPPDDAVLAGSDEPVVLQWASVSLLRDDEWYALTLYQPLDGVVSATLYTRATAWRVPFELLLTASAEQREFRWWVQVVRESRNRRGVLVYREAGDPSEVRAFTWVGPTPTPTVTPSPTVTLAP